MVAHSKQRAATRTIKMVMRTAYLKVQRKGLQRVHRKDTEKVIRLRDQEKLGQWSSEGSGISSG